ncbi:hypothetical protein BTR25_19420 [Bacillus sp. MRMR6]|nr:hypothetical protein BTR25_19420 [Bacillus sp. MRMR6]
MLLKVEYIYIGYPPTCRPYFWREIVCGKHGATYYLPPKDAEEVTFHFTPINDADEYNVGETTI